MQKAWLVPESEVMIGATGFDLQPGQREEHGSSKPSTSTTKTNRSKSPDRGSIGPSVALVNYYERKLGWWNAQTIALHKTACLSRPATFDFATTNRVHSMHNMSQENIMKFTAIIVQRNGSVFHAFQLCRDHRGSLYRVLMRSPYEFNGQVKLSLAMDVCNGLSCLHKNDIVHGFLDAWNCIVDNKWVVKLTNWSQVS